MRSTEAEAALREHPGVRDAAVIFRDANSQERKLVGYVVPDAAYFEKVTSEAEEGSKRLQKWRKTFDLMQFGKDAAASPVAFNVAGWNSSYTRQPIPAEEMREWIEETVKSILALEPREILEIGCGSGLLLLRIAPSCKRYTGTDFSGAVLQRLKEQLAQSRSSWDAVALFERAADNFEGFEPQSFDTVVLNSVVQYFPSVAYLTRVLEQALTVLKPGGKIFVGDVLSLPLLEAYSASVELFQAAPAKSVAELREQVARRIHQQPHLLISPSYFLALKKKNPAISRVEIRPKRGRFDNELTRFRFDVTIHVGEGRVDWCEPQWRDWTSAGFTLAVLRAALENPQCKVLALKSVTNARVQRDVLAAKVIAGASEACSVADLKADLDRGEPGAAHPQTLFQLADELGYQLDWSWASSREDGSFDAIFRRVGGTGEQLLAPVGWPEPANVSSDLTPHTNTPGQATLNNKLIQELLVHCGQKLPAALVPAAVVLVEAIPVKADGEPDLAALPFPDLSVA